MIFALPARGDTDYSMRIFNSDGSEPEMCGNGIRCLVSMVKPLTLTVSVEALSCSRHVLVQF